MGFCVLSTISHKQAHADPWKKKKKNWKPFTLHLRSTNYYSEGCLKKADFYADPCFDVEIKKFQSALIRVKMWKKKNESEVFVVAPILPLHQIIKYSSLLCNYISEMKE